MYNIFMNTISISHARIQLPDLVKQVANSIERFFITVNGKTKAVLISQEELESFEETTRILSIPGARKFIKKGAMQARKSQGVVLE